MAIIPGVPQVRVDIVVDGHQLPEYLDEDNSESKTSTSITKYVECKAGTRFAIRVNVASLGRRHLEGGNSAEVMYYVDGQQIDGLVLQRPWPSADDVFARHTTRYRECGTWKERDLMFTDLVTSMLFACYLFRSSLTLSLAEDEAYSKPRPELNDLGTITVKFYIARAGKTEYCDYGDSSEFNVGHENIHEKHLKGQAISTQAK
jgi:hypothetical protein